MSDPVTEKYIISTAISKRTNENTLKIYRVHETSLLYARKSRFSRVAPYKILTTALIFQLM